MSTGTTSARAQRGFLHHIHPPMVRKDALKLTHTWGLGGMALVLVFIQAATGLLLNLSYTPDVGGAYDSILIIREQLLFGKLIRNLHYWGGNFLIIIAFCHMFRVYFTGGFGSTRKGNWWIGLCLFTGIIIANFTGYLLPFDQLSFWAITISMGMFDYIPLIGTGLREFLMGSDRICQATLSGFYALHVTVLPAVSGLLLLFHFWLVRKAGGVVCFDSGQHLPGRSSGKVPTVPHLVTREITTALGITAIVLLTAVFFDAPLADRANDTLSPNPARPPWYFAGFQELLRHVHPVVAVVVVPLILIPVSILLPVIKTPAGYSGWFISPKGRRTGLISACAACLFMSLFICFSDGSVKMPQPFSTGLSAAVTGLPDFMLLLSGVAAMAVSIKKTYKTGKDETIQAVTVFFIVCFLILTIAGAWFR